MKITSILLFDDYSPDPLELSFEDPTSQNPYQVQKLTGLDADEITQRYYGTGGSGKKFYEFTQRPRQIAVKLGLNPRWSSFESYSDLRDELYRLIASSRSGEITIAFVNDGVTIATLKGVVVKMEGDLNEAQPFREITFLCKDPMLRSPVRTEVDLTGLDPSDTVVADMASTAPHGVFLEIKFNAAASTFTLAGDDGWSFTTTPVGTSDFQINDVLVISSEFGAKGLFINRGGTLMPIADSIAAGSVWPVIFPRDNTFECSGNVTWEGISYLETYWGV